MMFVIIYGDLNEGIQGIIGPFDTEDEAESYMEKYNLGHYDKFVRGLESPTEVIRFPVPGEDWGTFDYKESNSIESPEPGQSSE